ncbi:MAG TPA: hypothetical protein VET48_04810 [Steroidobacteraceae bacterium]|nr:hypothetical protein [Steroidobacteraceae bacterium]
MPKAKRQPVTIDGSTGQVSEMPIVNQSNQNNIFAPFSPLLTKESALVLGLGLIAGYFAGKSDILESLFESDDDGDDDDD